MLLLHARIGEVMSIEIVAIVHAVHDGRVKGIGLIRGIVHARIDSIGLVL